MFEPLEIQFALLFVSAFIIGLLAWINVRRSEHLVSRSAVVAIGILWGAFCTIQYWMLGPFSALGQSDEHNALIPWLYFLTQVHDGSLFAHGYSGGIDATVGMDAGTQYVSVHRILFTALPPWLAILTLKLGAIGLAYSGGYGIARVGLGLEREKGIIIGLLASVGNLLIMGWAVSSTGWSIALLPVVFHVVCLRTDRQHYHLWVFVLALLYAASTTVKYLPALYVALLIGALLLPPKKTGRFAVGCALFGLVCLLNWLDVLYAFIQLAPESARANAAPALFPPHLALLYTIRYHADFLILPVGIVALGILAVRGDRFVFRAVPAFALAVGLGVVLSYVNWRTLGVPYLYAYRWTLLSEGYVLIVLIITARAMSNLDWAVPHRLWHLRLPPLSVAYFSTIAVLAAADHKALDIIRYQYYGGQAHLTRTAYLSDCNWRPREPFRVVTAPSLFAPNTPNAYNLNTFDGDSNNFSQRKNLYFGLAVNRPAKPLENPTHNWLNVPSDASVLGTTVNLDALRVANVRFVLSGRKLDDPGLTLVSQTCSGGPFLGVNHQFEKWLRSWAPRAATNTPFIYEIPKAWPRVFVPTEFQVSAAAINDPTYYSELLGSPVEPIALFSRTDAYLLRDRKLLPDAYVLMGYRIVPNGFDIEVALRRQAATGLVVVNAPYSRLWHATSGGHSVSVVPANGIHMALILEDINGLIELRYERHTLATAARKFIEGFWVRGGGLRSFLAEDTRSEKVLGHDA